MDQSEITGLKNRIWRRLSKSLSKESVVQAAKMIQRAAVMFFGCGTKRYDLEDEMLTSGAPNIWKTGASQREIMEYYKKKIVIFEDEPIIPIGGDGLPGKENKYPENEKEELTKTIEQEKKETDENGVADIIRQIEQNRREYDASERQKTHTESWAGRADHTKCCLGWDYIYGRRDCVGKECQGPMSSCGIYLEDTTESILSNLDESDLTNPFLLDIIKENQSSSTASCLDLGLGESDLANPFILDMIKQRLSAGGMSGCSVSGCSDGIDLSNIEEADLSNPFLLDVIKDGGF